MAKVFARGPEAAGARQCVPRSTQSLVREARWTSMRFTRANRISIIWLIWFVLPFVPLFVDMVVGWFRTSRAAPMVMQESGLQWEAMAAFAVAWLILGLVPSLMLQGESVRLGNCCWSTSSGARWPGGTGVRQSWRHTRRHRASTVGEPCAFELADSFKQSVEVSPTNGPAAGVRFSLGSAEWGDASRRAGGHAIPGKVYKGKRDLWFASVD